jgi:hypothetical protein
VAVHHCPFQHLVGRNELIEFGIIDEKVVNPVDLSWTWVSGRRADTESDFGVSFADSCNNGSFADSGGARHHNQAPRVDSRSVTVWTLSKPFAQGLDLSRTEIPQSLSRMNRQLGENPFDLGWSDAAQGADKFRHSQRRFE